MVKPVMETLILAECILDVSTDQKYTEYLFTYVKYGSLHPPPRLCVILLLLDHESELV